MFEGTVSLNLDAKGRLAIPARHRDALISAAADSQGTLVLTAHPHRCLLLYPAPLWQPFSDQLNKLSSFDPRTAAVRRLMVGNAVTQEADSAGRLLISSTLREFAGLNKTVFLVGMGNHLEIWSEEGWKRQNDLAADVFASDALPIDLAGLAL